MKFDMEKQVHSFAQPVWDENDKMYDWEPCPGLTLREYAWVKFAAASLGHEYTQNDGNADKAAEWVGQLADAIVAEMEKRE